MEPLRMGIESQSVVLTHFADPSSPGCGMGCTSQHAYMRPCDQSIEGSGHGCSGIGRVGRLVVDCSLLFPMYIITIRTVAIIPTSTRRWRLRVRHSKRFAALPLSGMHSFANLALDYRSHVIATVVTL